MCDECVHMQAYCDVAAYADRACTIANSRTELRVLLVVLNCVTNAIHAKNFSKLLTFTANSNIVINGINAVTKNVKAKINAINVAKGNTPVSKTGDNDERSKSMSRSISVAGGSVSLRRDFSKRLDWAADFRPDEGDKIIVDCSNCACTLS